jgi:hypothetical protein
MTPAVAEDLRNGVMKEDDILTSRITACQVGIEVCSKLRITSLGLPLMAEAPQQISRKSHQQFSRYRMAERVVRKTTDRWHQDLE